MPASMPAAGCRMPSAQRRANSAMRGHLPWQTSHGRNAIRMLQRGDRPTPESSPGPLTAPRLGSFDRRQKTLARAVFSPRAGWRSLPAAGIEAVIKCRGARDRAIRATNGAGNDQREPDSRAPGRGCGSRRCLCVGIT